MSAPGLVRRVVDRARWELGEWRRPSRAAFVQEELDQAALDQIQWRAGERVLDVGCGSGKYLEALKRRGANSFGIDVVDELAGMARLAGHAVAGGSGLALPFVDGSFDAIFCHRTLHLLERPEQVVAEFRRVIREGGRVVYSTSNTMSPYGRVQSWAVGVERNQNWRTRNRWSAEEWCRAFRRGGFVARGIYSCNLVWPLVYRVCDRWIVPNEWMRRYCRWVRRWSRVPLRTDRALSAAMDYVVEMERK